MYEDCLGVVVHSYTPSAREAKARGGYEVEADLSFINELRASLHYKVREISLILCSTRRDTRKWEDKSVSPMKGIKK